MDLVVVRVYSLLSQVFVKQDSRFVLLLVYMTLFIAHSRQLSNYLFRFTCSLVQPSEVGLGRSLTALYASRTVWMSSSVPSETSTASDKESKIKKRRGNNLLETAFPLANHGIGIKFHRKIWNYPDSFYMLTRLKPNDFDHARGRAWGVLTWRGQTEEKESPVGSVHKRDWKIWNKDQQELQGAFIPDPKKEKAVYLKPRLPKRKSGKQ